MTVPAVVGVLVLAALAAGVYFVRAALTASAASPVDARPQSSVQVQSGARGTADGGKRTDSAPTSAPGGAGAAAGGAQGAGPGAGASPTVHVLGAVRRPGVYALASGGRVNDAIAAAGGAAEGADLARLNLARPVTDGEQLFVPRPGEQPPTALTPAVPQPAAGAGGAPAGAAAGTSAGSPAGGAASATGAGPGAGSTSAPGVGAPAVGAGGAAAGGLIDLNSATLEQLDSLPGVGPVLAQRILDWRTEHGRFTSVDELGEVSGIGDKLMGQLRPKVTV